MTIQMVRHIIMIIKSSQSLEFFIFFYFYENYLGMILIIILDEFYYEVDGEINPIFVIPGIGTHGRCLVINEAQALRACLSSIPHTRARNIIPCDLFTFSILLDIPV